MYMARAWWSWRYSRVASYSAPPRPVPRMPRRTARKSRSPLLTSGKWKKWEKPVTLPAAFSLTKSTAW